jgi:NADPH:quinone reductase-like Zn-dependent oxidoreductase
MRVKKPGGLAALYPDAAEPRAAGSGEIQVRVRSTTLNFHDYLVVTGGLTTVDGRIPMSDGAGVVTATGDGVTEFAVGDHVISTFFPNWAGGAIRAEKNFGVPGDHVDGFASEYVTAGCEAFTRAPAGYGHAEAATLTCAGLTAWRAVVVEGRAQPGQTVLVLGTGSVSIFALQFAKACGCRVIATSSSDAKLERLRALGADETINYRQTPDWGRRAFQLAGNRGVDHVVEVGGSGTLDQSISACTFGGHISLIGVLAGRKGEVLTAKIMARQIRLVGITVGSREHQLDMIAGIEANGIRPIIDRSFPLEALADAFRHQESGAHFGKIVVEF